MATVKLGTICPGCLAEAKTLVLFGLSQDRFVCELCFDKVREVEKTEPHHQGTEP